VFDKLGGTFVTGITIVTDKLKSVLENLEVFKKNEVLIGIPAEKTQRKPYENESVEINNAQIGFINEFGSPLNRIPARPFLIPAIKKVKPKIVTILKTSAKNFTKDKTAVLVGLEKSGTLARDAAKNIIRTQEGFQALSPKTIAERKRKNKNVKGEKALIRTGQLLNSLTYVVRNK